MATWSRCMADRRFLPWLEWVFSLFYPPFCLICRILQRLELTEAECTLIVLLWITKPWYTKLLHLLIDTPVLLPKRKNLVTHPLTGKAHPTLYKTRFLACGLSGNFCKNQEFLAKQQTFFYLHGDQELQRRVTPMSNDDFVLSSKGSSSTSANCNSVLQFLTLLYEEGKGYISLNIAQCAISTLWERTLWVLTASSANFWKTFSTGALLCPGTM